MSVPKPMKHFTFTDELGMRRRPAGLLAKTARLFTSDVRLVFSSRISDAKNILDIVSLGVTQGDEFAVCAEGADAGEAVQAISALLVSSLACCSLQPELLRSTSASEV